MKNNRKNRKLLKRLHDRCTIPGYIPEKVPKAGPKTFFKKLKMMDKCRDGKIRKRTVPLIFTYDL